MFKHDDVLLNRSDLNSILVINDIRFNLFLDNHKLDSPFEKLARRTKVLMKLWMAISQALPPANERS
jgi:hypothetical protein